MSYNILSNGSYLSAMYPTGSIIANSGVTADNGGWVICDGVARGMTDGRYINIIALGIGSTAGGNYTPPNLKGAFLRGTGTSPISTTYAGPALKNFQDQQIVSHTHISSSHNHLPINYGGTNYYAFNKFKPSSSSSVTDSSATEFNLLSNQGLPLNTVNTSSNTFTAGTVTNTTYGNETVPANYAVNWILKL